MPNRSHERAAFDAVLLDAAGTLITPREPVGETYAAVARQYGAEIEPAALSRAFVEVFRGMPDLAFKAASRAELQRLEREWWHTLVFRVVRWSGHDIDEFDPFMETLFAHYAEGRAWQCFPEVATVLQQLRVRGCKLAVVSNFDSRLPGILQALEIHEQLDAVIYSSRAGSAKPDRAIFAQALETLGVAPEHAIHVGDSVDADYHGAVAAGLEGLLISRDNAPAPDFPHRIHSLDQLLTRLGR